MKRILTITLLVLTFVLTSFAQEKIFSKEKADELYGTPVQSVKINVKVLKSLLDTHEYVMIRIKKNKVNIFGKNRTPIIKQFESNDKDIYYVFETKDIGKLLNIDKAQVSDIELRTGGNALQKDRNNVTADGEIVTITCGTVTLLPPFWCPPFCFGDDDD